jgi:hypothetical protein
MDTSPLTQEGFQNVIRNYGYDSIYVPNSSITFYPHGAHIQGDYIIAFDESQVSDWQRVDAD